MKFEVTEEQQVRIDEWQSWLEEDNAPTGAIGGRFEYRFCCTSLGVTVVCYDYVTKTEIDVTDYEGW